MKPSMVVSGSLLVVGGFSFILVQFLFPSSSLLYWSGLAFPLIVLVGGVLLLFLVFRGKDKWLK